MFSKSSNKPWVDWMVGGLALLLLILAGWWCGQLVWAFIGVSQDLPDIEVKESAPNHQEIKLTTELNGHEVAGWSLFGKTGAKQEVVPAPQEAPKTSLNLTLVGAFVGHDQESSTAMIVASGRNAEVYRVGDALPGGANLQAVYHDRVIIDYRGRAETLFFDTEDAVLTEGPTRSSVSDDLNTLSPQALLSRARTSPANFVSEIGINLENGQYVLDSGWALSALMPIGGRRGDIIREWNGAKLTGDPQQDIEFMMTSINSGQTKYTIVLDRKGVPILLEGSVR